MKKSFLLQYVYVMTKNDKILVCDDAGHEFLDPDTRRALASKLKQLKLQNTAINTTISIGNTSYILRIVPASFPRQPESETDYIITIRNQSMFAAIYKQILQNPDFPVIFDKFKSGVFITNSRGDVVFANKTYADITGFKLSDVIGKHIVSLENAGLLSPLITPTILETGEALTVVQQLGTGKQIIVSGDPLYDGDGKLKFIVTCTNAIDKIEVGDLPASFYDTALLKASLKNRKPVQSIDIIAESRSMQDVMHEAAKVAQHDVTVLLLGGSGAGKQVLSTIIHADSRRNNENFVKINCSAISPMLFESELFGYEEGAFTGALKSGKAGLFEIANNGTILLDEIGDMPIDFQAKLLRVLQEKEFYKVGALTPTKVNVRIIAATNRNLEALIEKGLFREDLYYRLNVVSIVLPPLRQRKEDIKPLVLHFCFSFNKKYGTNKKFSNELIDLIEQYDWPGNVRELQNLVERLIILCNEDIILPKHFLQMYNRNTPTTASEDGIMFNHILPLKEAVAMTESTLVSKAMQMCKNTRDAAKLLGISQSTIMRKIKEYDL